MNRFVSLVLFILSSLIASHGAWRLIDDFQQWNAGDIYVNSTEVGWHGSGDFLEFWFLPDPHDPVNIALYVPAPLYTSHYSDLFIMKELSDGGIPPGESGTLYFRSLYSGNAFSWYIGTSDKPVEYDPVSGLQVSPGAWDDFNTLIRLNPDTNIFEHRDGDQYVLTDPPLSPIPNKWYEFVLHVDNHWDMSTTPPTSVGVYTLYMHGQGIGNDWTLIPVMTDPPKDSAFFRRHPADDNGNPRAITWVMFATNPGSPTRPAVDPFLLDDFYFSHGLTFPNICIPEPWFYCWPIINSAGDVYTETLFGWLNVSQAPYIWSYSLDGWIFMWEPACDAPGAWAYIYK